MEMLIQTLLLWIAANTQYSIDNVPYPHIQTMTPEQITQEFYTDAPDLIPNDGIDDRINALYAPQDGDTGTIYVLSPEFITDSEYYDNPGDNPLFREIVLHELVHHLQWYYEQNKQWQCQNYGEREAYIIGGKYLHSTHTPDPIPNRMFWANMYGRC